MKNLFILCISILMLSGCGNSSSSAQPVKDAQELKSVAKVVEEEASIQISEIEQEVPVKNLEKVKEVTVAAGPSSDGKTRISGVVKYDGEVPKLREIKMDGDPICLMKHDGPVYPQTLELGPNKEMANIFVYIKSGLPKKAYPTPADEVIVTQAGCTYSPHVFGIMVNQPLKILNPDGTLHNVHALSKINPEFNLAMPKFRKEVVKTFAKPEMFITFNCDVHPWMLAFASVMEHPYFQVTQKDGYYSIEDLPAGTYVVQAWHERLESQEQTVTIAKGQTQEINFTFSKPQ